MRRLLYASLIVSATALGCGDNDSGASIDAAIQADARGDGPAIDAPGVDAPLDAPGIDAPPDAPNFRGPLSFDLAGGANGILWVPSESTLYFTDNNSDKLRKYTDAGGLADVATLPAGSAGISLGDIVRQADGTVLVANFGFGTQGTIFRVNTDGTSEALTGLVPNRRRIALRQATDGTLYEAYFVGGGGGTPVGGVAAVTLAGTAATETEIATLNPQGNPFKKLVGLELKGDAVYLSDQTDKRIYKIALPGFAVTDVATVPAADLLSQMPNGDLLGGGSDVYRIDATTNAVTTLISDVDQVRGTAYDNVAKRLFLIEHSTMAGVADKLVIRPIDN